MSTNPLTTTPEKDARAAQQGRLLATGSLLGALLASSCCIAPLVLLVLGVSGAWIANLTALAPYQPLFLLATAGFLGAGFWTVYRRPRVKCEADSYCASPTSGRIVRGALWIATVLVLAALAVNLVVPTLL